VTIYRSDNEGKPNWGIFTIKDALSAKHHAEMYSSRWRKETWSKWFKFLPTIGVKYSKKDKAYYDIKK
jgi:IS4 transposase